MDFLIHLNTYILYNLRKPKRQSSVLHSLLEYPHTKMLQFRLFIYIGKKIIICHKTWYIHIFNIYDTIYLFSRSVNTNWLKINQLNISRGISNINMPREKCLNVCGYNRRKMKGKEKKRTSTIMNTCKATENAQLLYFILWIFFCFVLFIWDVKERILQDVNIYTWLYIYMVCVLYIYLYAHVFYHTLILFYIHTYRERHTNIQDT